MSWWRKKRHVAPAQESAKRDDKDLPEVSAPPEGPGGAPVDEESAIDVKELARQFSKQSVSALKNDRERDGSVTGLAAAAKTHYEQANNQRKILFWAILVMGSLTWLAVVLFVFGVSFKWFTIDTPIAVAFITALCAQVFGLLFTLSKGLYAWTITSKMSEDSE